MTDRSLPGCDDLKPPLDFAAQSLCQPHRGVIERALASVKMGKICALGGVTFPNVSGTLAASKELEKGKMSQAEEELLRGACAGNTRALTDLLDAVTPPLRVQLDKKIGNKYAGALEAKDVLQVSYLDAFLKFNRFDASAGVPGFVAWFQQIANHNLIDAIRGLGRQKTPPPGNRIHPVAAEDSYVDLLDFLTGTTGTPSRYASKAEVKQILEREISNLPEDYAQVVRLLDLDGRPVGDVAARLERSKGAVHMLRARAHERLRENLGSPSQFFTDSA